jgi:hypothetical protein
VTGVQTCALPISVADAIVISAASGGIAATVGANNFNVTGGNLVFATAATGVILPGTVSVVSGSGSPSGSVTAGQGSLYLRTDGSSTSTRAYINTNGGTTWTAITTVA